MYCNGSSQDGGLGRYALLPHTTKRRTTANLKTKNKNCQKTELNGSPTTKELNKKHSYRLLEGVERGSWGREDVWQGGGWWIGIPHNHMWIKWEEQLRNKTNHATQGSSTGK